MFNDHPEPFNNKQLFDEEEIKYREDNLKNIFSYGLDYWWYDRNWITKLISPTSFIAPQIYINELTNQIIDNAKSTANMQWIIDKNSGIGQGKLTNRPGLVIRKNPDSCCYQPSQQYRISR